MQYGLRWEAQIQPDPITPRDRSSTRRSSARPRAGVPVRRQDPVGHEACGSRASASRGIPSGDGKQVVRASAGIFYARIPGLSLASIALDQRQPRPDALPQQRVQRLRRHAAGVSEPDSAVADRRPRSSRTSSSSTRTSRTRAPTSAACRYERELIANYGVLSSTTTRRPMHITRFINRNDPVFGSPWSTGLGAGRHERHRHADDGRELGEEPLRRRHARHDQAATSHNYQFQVELHASRRTSRTTTTSAIRSRSATRGSTTWRPSTTTPTATSATASTPGCS